MSGNEKGERKNLRARCGVERLVFKNLKSQRLDTY